MIMIHVIIPHLHIESDLFEEHNDTAVTSGFDLASVQHALTHFKHMTGNENIVVKSVVVKNLDKKNVLKKNVPFLLHQSLNGGILTQKDCTTSDYSGYYIFYFTEINLHSFSLRGPPLC